MVEYASGHRTEAQHVAQTLGIGEVMSMEGAVASVVNGTSLVVIAGADKESLVGSGIEQLERAVASEGRRAAPRAPEKPRATKPPQRAKRPPVKLQPARGADRPTPQVRA